MKKSTKIALAAAGATAAAAGTAYVLSLRCRKGNPTLDVLRQYRFAHRGYYEKGVVPENSLPAFRRAVERGWGIELDVHLLKDGTLAVLHDSDLARMTGAEGVVEDLDLAGLMQLRLDGTEEQIPTFNQVLQVVNGKTPLIIELKTTAENREALVKTICERLDRYDGTYCIESFDPKAIAVLAELRPEVCRGVLARNFLKEPFGLKLPQQILATNMNFNFQAQPDFVAYNFADRALMSNQVCQKLWGVQSVSWTIRSREELDECEREGSIPIFEGFDPDAE